VKKPMNPTAIPITEPATSIHCTVWPIQRSRPYPSAVNPATDAMSVLDAAMYGSARR
jgi:hypothetical protein